MKKLLFLISAIINSCLAYCMSMNTDEQIAANYAFMQEFIRKLHSPTYIETLMLQRGISREKIPQEMHKFYQEMQRLEKEKRTHNFPRGDS